MNEILQTVYGFAVLSLRICSVESTDLQSRVYGFAVVVLGGFKCLQFCSAQSTLFNQSTTFNVPVAETPEVGGQGGMCPPKFWDIS
jgi:hypothetical protein